VRLIMTKRRLITTKSRLITTKEPADHDEAPAWCR
jgi:hypothetical protein